jgi:hypothetical protein
LNLAHAIYSQPPTYRLTSKLKPIQGFRFAWKGSLQANPFQDHPRQHPYHYKNRLHRMPPGYIVLLTLLLEKRSTGGAMWKDTDVEGNPAALQARAMIDAFTSVGAEHFDVTWTTRQGEKSNFRRHVSAENLKHFLPQLIASAEKHERNLIVRPVSRRAVFIQLDDLGKEGMERLKSVAFLGLETSPGNYQAWVAMPGGACDKEFARRLRKGAGADETASGATRAAGTLNFKEKYAAAFPRVQLAYSSPGLMTSAAQIESIGLVAEPEQAIAYYPVPQAFRTRTGKWPNYKTCLQGAPESKSRPGHPRESIADFTWCLTAISWGHGIEETAARLMEESAKARENGGHYALQTAQNAAAANERNRQKSRA